MAFIRERWQRLRERNTADAGAGASLPGDGTVVDGSALHVESARVSEYNSVADTLQKAVTQLSAPTAPSRRRLPTLSRPTPKRLGEALARLLAVLVAEIDAEAPGQTGPCLQDVLERGLFAALAEACLPDAPVGCRAAWLKFFGDLLDRVHRPLLIHTEVLDPLHLTLRYCRRAQRAALVGSGAADDGEGGGGGERTNGATRASSTGGPLTGSGGPRTGNGNGSSHISSYAVLVPLSDADQVHLVALLSSVCRHAADDPSLLALLLVQHPRPAFPVAAALLPFVHEAGRLGRTAQHGLVILCDLATRHDGLRAFLQHHSDFCQHVGLSLSALYAAVPTALPRGRHVWRLGAKGLERKTPELAPVLGLLDFCDTLLSSCPQGIAEAVVDGVMCAFLQPVLLPALHQRRAADAAAATAYYNIFLLQIRYPALLRAFLRLALADRLDNTPTLALLARRMDALGDLGFLTLRLLHTLLDLHCEDAMLVLCLRHLARRASVQRRAEDQRRTAAALLAPAQAATSVTAGSEATTGVTAASEAVEAATVGVALDITASEAGTAVTPDEAPVGLRLALSSDEAAAGSTGAVALQLWQRERRHWREWGLAMEGSRWLLQLRSRLSPASPHGRSFADYVIAARCTMTRAQAACGAWANSYTLTDAYMAFGCDAQATETATGAEAEGNDHGKAAGPRRAEVGADSGTGEASSDEGVEESTTTVTAEEMDGMFLAKLSSMLERMSESSVQTNLLVTDLTRQLAAYPHPLIRAFVFGRPGMPLEGLRAAAEAEGGGLGRAARDCLLTTLAHVQAQLRREETAFPTLAEDLAAYRVDADGYFKSAETTAKGARGTAKARRAKAAPATATHAPSASAVTFRRRTQHNTSNLSADTDHSLTVAEWASVASHDAGSGSLVQPSATERASYDDSGAPSIVAQSERSERSVRSAASFDNTRLSTPDGASPALTRRALAEHEARVAVDTESGVAGGNNEPGNGATAGDEEADTLNAQSDNVTVSDDKLATAVAVKEGRKFALKVLIFEEFLKELAALGLEHALLSVHAPEVPRAVDDRFE